jgi:hypothetical protein
MSLGMPLNALSLFQALVPSSTTPSVTPAKTAASAASQLASSSPFANLNLTTGEQSQIAAILRSSQGQSFAQIANNISGILTPTQKQTFASDLQSMESSGGHHHHHHGSGGSGSSTTIDSGTDGFGVASTSNASPTATAASSIFSDLAAQFSAQSQTQSQSMFSNL